MTKKMTPKEEQDFLLFKFLISKADADTAAEFFVDILREEIDNNYYYFDMGFRLGAALHKHPANTVAEQFTIEDFKSRIRGDASSLNNPAAQEVAPSDLLTGE